MVDEKDFIQRNGRKLYAFNCNHCGKKAYRRKDHLLKFPRHFCSASCKHKDQVKATKMECATCGETILKTPAEMRKSKSGNLFCNNSCAASHNNKFTKVGEKHHNYKNGRASYRQKAFRHYESKCHNPDCLLSHQLEKIPQEMLDVDHIDNDRDNNHISNLRILCVWCHGLKTREIEISIDTEE